jgi:enediyne polyketide synthase
MSKEAKRMSTNTRIAVVGLSCRYPDANTPGELWENILAGRRAFRRMPDERMPAADYWSADPATPDRHYGTKAAVINGYTFDRVKYNVAGSTYRSTDLTHWLALDVAAEALADAGFPGGEGLPRERTGVVVGNTLTGEFTRANLMRLRWPYVRRTIGAALTGQGWDTERLAAFLAALETSYKQPFPPVDEDTLAGGLSNTIAGRICNYFDLNGGGFTVDGACSSSLLSVATVCKALVSGELDAAIAGGVDLSIDPFEVIGFAKTGALTATEMRVYDKDSAGFWPGEGCGMAVLMREEDARKQDKPIYALIAGWGISSDGKGGMTRPEVNGYRLALRRAYERAGFGMDTVSYFEGHGTGTKVGDATELRALTLSRQAAGTDVPPAAIGTVKALFGHPKAAAGIGGLIKAVLAVHHEVLPPTVGCHNPHEEFLVETPALRALETAEAWPADQPVRAGISSMGFGGIYTHLVVEGTQRTARGTIDARTRSIAGSAQDSEILLLDARDSDAMKDRLRGLLTLVPRLAYAELGDLAAELQRRLSSHRVRAAIVARSPEDAATKLGTLLTALEAGTDRVFDGNDGIFCGRTGSPPRIGFLFPGQGTGRGRPAHGLRLRFREAEEVIAGASLSTGGDVVATAVAQPRIVAGSVAGLRVLAAFGIEAAVAVGHSLGELTALHWAGAMDLPTLLRLASQRGQLMAEFGEAGGSMASVAAPPETVQAFIGSEPVVIAGFNSAEQTVVSGPTQAVLQVIKRAETAGMNATPLRVSHAFHSPLVATAATEFGARVAGETLQPVTRRVVSTITGVELPADVDLSVLLHDQIVRPVRFVEASTGAAASADFFVEVGPGSVLSDLTAVNTTVPALALDTDSRSIGGLLHVVAAAYVAGADVRHARLFEGRLVRPLDLNGGFSFFASPCEAAPQFDIGAVSAGVATAPAPAVTDEPTGDETSAPTVETADDEPEESALDRLTRVTAQRAELPPTSVHPDSRFLDDLHLSSITVGQIANQVATELGAQTAPGSSNFATATVAEVAKALDELDATPAADGGQVIGAGPWVRTFVTELVATGRPAPADGAGTSEGTWEVYAAAGHPIAKALRAALQEANLGSGVLLCLPPDAGEQHIGLGLSAVQAALAGSVDRFVVVQHGRGMAGLAKTLHLEAPAIRTTILDIDPAASSIPQIVADVAATAGFAEILYDAEGTRRVPVLRLFRPGPGEPGSGLGPTDVLLVSGGGKGIMAECALAMAGDSGAKLAVMGRSDPTEDAELTANLARFAKAGISYRYERCDVTDGDAVRAGLAAISDEFGPVTAIFHGAGQNRPAPIQELDETSFQRTVATKIDGLCVLLDAVDADALRLLVTFGSIIGRAGLAGEAHYSTANEWLADLTRGVAAEHSTLRTVCLEWSVWAGAGMGERLGVIDTLTREGITPISIAEGVDVLRSVVAAAHVPPVLVVTGRAGGLDTIQYERHELPLLRFVDQVLVDYPGVELVTVSTLTSETDLYLADHELDGAMLVPAVIGMEAMAQVAYAVTGNDSLPLIEAAEFLNPIVVVPGGSNTIRVSAVVNAGGNRVTVTIRSSDTGFGADHFRARLSYDAPSPAATAPAGWAQQPTVPLDPARDLYGDLLFQGKLFQRLVRYHRVAALDCEADVGTEPAEWFSTFMPHRLLLGDPGLRDSLMHGIQVCVPDATLLPAGVDRIWMSGIDPDAAVVTFRAVERSRAGDSYLYDVEVRADGVVVERWDGLRLQAARKRDPGGPWVAPLLGTYLQRKLAVLIGFPGAIAAQSDAEGVEPRANTALAVGRALNRVAEIRYDDSGKPAVDGANVSASHGGGVTLAVTAAEPVGCDIETVVDRERAEWVGLLGIQIDVADLVARETAETAASACTRLWSAMESLAKAGAPASEPLVPIATGRDRWIVFSAGDWRVATFATTLRGESAPVAVVTAVAVLIEVQVS